MPNTKKSYRKRENFDMRFALTALKLPRPLRNRIEKALTRIDQRSYSEAIINCYLVSETLVKDLSAFLYPELKAKQVKHEDKLKRIWNDEEKEKHELPGIKVIASLLTVVLWYRNKMGAHTEMKPNKGAARICVSSLIQALVELERLGIVNTSGKLESIDDLTDDQIMDLAENMNSAQLKELMKAAFDKISKIETQKDIERNRNLCYFIRCSIKERNQDRIELFEMFFNSFFPTTTNMDFALVEELLSILAESVKIVSIRNWITEKGHIDKIISEFARSRSFDMAGINSRIIAGLLPHLTSRQLTLVIDAAVANDQIHLSYSAKRDLKPILDLCEDKVAEAKLRELRKKMK